MYNNLESETLILKRLESALANEDNDLLKIAAYKLHEKFHSGYKFEYIKQLKSVYDYVYDNPVFNEEIVHLLTSTIEDIINQKDEPKKEDVTSVIDSILPSSNIFKSYSEEYKPEPKTEIQQSLFNNFIQGETSQETYKESDYTVETTPETHQETIIEEKSIESARTSYSEISADYQEESIQESYSTFSEEEIPQPKTITSDNSSEIINNQPEEVFEENKEVYAEYSEEIKEEIKEESTEHSEQYSKEENYNYSKERDVCLFLGEKNSDIDTKFIKDFIKTLNEDKSLSKELGELQAFINIAEQDLGPIDKIINPIKNSSEKLFVITNSINGKILEILKSCNLENSENFDFYALSGLTRILECTECNEKHVNYSELQILSAICPICGNYMLPNIETPKKCDVVEFEKALLALFKSNIWVLINPPKEDKKEFVNMFKMASRLKRPEAIYVLTQDENKKALYKEIFENTGIEVKTDYSNTESFLNDFLGE